MFDIQKMMKQAKKMQEDMAKAQDELGTVTVTGSAGGSAVVVTANGRGEVQNVKISKEAASGDVQTLNDLVLMAIQDAHKNAGDVAQKKMGSITQGLKLPGMPF